MFSGEPPAGPPRTSLPDVVSPRRSGGPTEFPASATSPTSIISPRVQTSSVLLPTVPRGVPGSDASPTARRPARHLFAHATTAVIAGGRLAASVGGGRGRGDVVTPRPPPRTLPGIQAISGPQTADRSRIDADVSSISPKNRSEGYALGMASSQSFGSLGAGSRAGSLSYVGAAGGALVTAFSFSSTQPSSSATPLLLNEQRQSAMESFETGASSSDSSGGPTIANRHIVLPGRRVDSVVSLSRRGSMAAATTRVSSIHTKAPSVNSLVRSISNARSRNARRDDEAANIICTGASSCAFDGVQSVSSAVFAEAERDASLSTETGSNEHVVRQAAMATSAFASDAFHRFRDLFDLAEGQPVSFTPAASHRSGKASGSFQNKVSAFRARSPMRPSDEQGGEPISPATSISAEKLDGIPPFRSASQLADPQIVSHITPPLPQSSKSEYVSVPRDLDDFGRGEEVLRRYREVTVLSRHAFPGAAGAKAILLEQTYDVSSELEARLVAKSTKWLETNHRDLLAGTHGHAVGSMSSLLQCISPTGGFVGGGIGSGLPFGHSGGGSNPQALSSSSPDVFRVTPRDLNITFSAWRHRKTGGLYQRSFLALAKVLRELMIPGTLLCCPLNVTYAIGGELVTATHLPPLTCMQPMQLAPGSMLSEISRMISAALLGSFFSNIVDYNDSVAGSAPLAASPTGPVESSAPPQRRSSVVLHPSIMLDPSVNEEPSGSPQAPHTTIREDHVPAVDFYPCADGCYCAVPNANLMDALSMQRAETLLLGEATERMFAATSSASKRTVGHGVMGDSAEVNNMKRVVSILAQIASGLFGKGRSDIQRDQSLVLRDIFHSNGVPMKELLNVREQLEAHMKVSGANGVLNKESMDCCRELVAFMLAEAMARTLKAMILSRASAAASSLATSSDALRGSDDGWLKSGLDDKTEGAEHRVDDGTTMMPPHCAAVLSAANLIFKKFQSSPKFLRDSLVPALNKKFATSSDYVIDIRALPVTEISYFLQRRLGLCYNSHTKMFSFFESDVFDPKRPVSSSARLASKVKSLGALGVLRAGASGAAAAQEVSKGGTVPPQPPHQQPSSVVVPEKVGFLVAHMSTSFHPLVSANGVVARSIATESTATYLQQLSLLCGEAESRWRSQLRSKPKESYREQPANRRSGSVTMGEPPSVGVSPAMAEVFVSQSFDARSVDIGRSETFVTHTAPPGGRRPVQSMSPADRACLLQLHFVLFGILCEAATAADSAAASGQPNDSGIAPSVTRLAQRVARVFLLPPNVLATLHHISKFEAGFGTEVSRSPSRCISPTSDSIDSNSKHGKRLSGLRGVENNTPQVEDLRLSREKGLSLGATKGSGNVQTPRPPSGGGDLGMRRTQSAVSGKRLKPQKSMDDERPPVTVFVVDEFETILELMCVDAMRRTSSKVDKPIIPADTADRAQTAPPRGIPPDEMVFACDALLVCTMAEVTTLIPRANPLDQHMRRFDDSRVLPPHVAHRAERGGASIAGSFQYQPRDNSSQGTSFDVDESLPRGQVDALILWAAAVSHMGQSVFDPFLLHHATRALLLAKLLCRENSMRWSSLFRLIHAECTGAHGGGAADSSNTPPHSECTAGHQAGAVRRARRILQIVCNAVCIGSTASGTVQLTTDASMLLSVGLAMPPAMNVPSNGAPQAGKAVNAVIHGPETALSSYSLRCATLLARRAILQPSAETPGKPNVLLRSTPLSVLFVAMLAPFMLNIAPSHDPLLSSLSPGHNPPTGNRSSSSTLDSESSRLLRAKWEGFVATLQSAFCVRLDELVDTLEDDVDVAAVTSMQTDTLSVLSHGTEVSVGRRPLGDHTKPPLAVATHPQFLFRGFLDDETCSSIAWSQPPVVEYLALLRHVLNEQGLGGGSARHSSMPHSANTENLSNSGMSGGAGSAPDPLLQFVQAVDDTPIGLGNAYLWNSAEVLRFLASQLDLMLPPDLLITIDRFGSRMSLGTTTDYALSLPASFEVPEGPVSPTANGASCVPVAEEGQTSEARGEKLGDQPSDVGSSAAASAKSSVGSAFLDPRLPSPEANLLLDSNSKVFLGSPVFPPPVRSETTGEYKSVGGESVSFDRQSSLAVTSTHRPSASYDDAKTLMTRSLSNASAATVAPLPYSSTGEMDSNQLDPVPPPAPPPVPPPVLAVFSSSVPLSSPYPSPDHYRRGSHSRSLIEEVTNNSLRVTDGLQRCLEPAESTPLSTHHQHQGLILLAREALNREMLEEEEVDAFPLVREAALFLLEEIRALAGADVHAKARPASVGSGASSRSSKAYVTGHSGVVSVPSPSRTQSGEHHLSATETPPTATITEEVPHVLTGANESAEEEPHGTKGGGAHVHHDSDVEDAASDEHAATPSSSHHTSRAESPSTSACDAEEDHHLLETVTYRAFAARELLMRGSLQFEESTWRAKLWNQCLMVGTRIT